MPGSLLLRVVLMFFGLILFSGSLLSAEYFVAKSGNDANDGSAESPFLTIGKAAGIARAGDTVTVRRGIYREWVNPPRGGTSEQARIRYQAAPGEDVRIVGSEPVSEWQAEESLWRATLPNEFFGSFNPFNLPIRNPGSIPAADDDPNAEWGWLMYGRWAHRGDVFLNDAGLTEVETREGLSTPMTWFTEPSENGTTLWANFGEVDPNANRVEVNVREHGIYPTTPGLGYITIRGFKVMNIASHWAPPILPQPGAIGVNGGHHWVIEGNRVQHGKTVCISIGNPTGPANEAMAGHHVIRGNVMRGCGQAGIAGEAWNHHSLITGNVIEDINYRLEFGGYETAGIKLHRAVGSIIERNYIRNVRTQEGFAGQGIWIDYQNMHTQVRGNVLADISDIAIYFEGNWQGPHLITNNIVIGGENGSRIMSASSRGEAWLHNLFVNCQFEWVDQNYGGRPPINHHRWFNNQIVGGVFEGVPDRTDFQVKGNHTVPSVAESKPVYYLVREGQSVLLQFDASASLPEPVARLSPGDLDMPLEAPDGSVPRVDLDINAKERQPETLVGPFDAVLSGANSIEVFSLPEIYSE